jgi:predicted  nucleic acid-binding Zn-ribbon protein
MHLDWPTRELILARESVPSAREALGTEGAARARIIELEAELGSRVAALARADMLEAELAIARQRIVALEAEVVPARRRATEMEQELVTAWNRIEGAERALTNITGSASWKMTEPLRSAKRHVRRAKSCRRIWCGSRWHPGSCIP